MRTKLDLRRILISEQIFKYAALVFLFLTVFFLTLPTSYLSLYKLMLTLFDGYGSWRVYDLAFSSVYWGSFVTGLLLLISFPLSAKNERSVMEIVAISFALHSFVTQAFTALEIHRYSLQIYHPVTPGIGWLFFDMFLWFILVATFILLVAALSLLTSHKIARGLGLIISTLLLVSDLGRVLTQIFLSSRELTIVLGISSAMSIYYLWKSH